MKRYDVIVIGAGGSGLAAALSAAEHGAQVLVLEKQHQPGGTTGLSIGSFTAAGTKLQQQAGIDDSWQSHVEDVSNFAPPEIESRNDDPLRQFSLQEASETLAWLERLGLFFVGPNPEPPNKVARMHNVVPAGRAYVATLQLAAVKAGVTIFCNTSARELLFESGRVVGVRARQDDKTIEFFADGGVILAAGDYANSPQQIAEHKGSEFARIEGINPDAVGDGHRLALQAGAKLVNMDVTYGPELRFVPQARRSPLSWLPARGRLAGWVGWLASRAPRSVMRALVKRLIVTWQHPEDALFTDGAILLNHSGSRFVNEKQSPDREIAVAEQDRKQAFVLLDGDLMTRYSSWPHFVSTAPDIAYAYVKDYQRLRGDVTTTGYTLEDVALRSGLDLQNVQRAVDEYNQYVRGDQPDPFGRSNDLQTLTANPWVLLGPLKAYFTTTEGGATVNKKLQVLNESDEVIPGLYAVGQNGLGGMVLWGHGLHIAWALTSGRLAGRAAAESA